jgi:predicted MPP superfamily phosphohydrolase
VLTRVSVPIREWSRDLQGLKLVQFSDLHFQGVGPREEQLRRLVNAAGADVIVFTGDLFNSVRRAQDEQLVQEALEFFGSLRFSKAFFATLGEEEYPFRERLQRELEKVNVTLLDDRLVPLTVGGAVVNFVGLTEDSKTLDSYYGYQPSSTSSTANIERLRRLLQDARMQPYRDYRFHLAGQYSLRWRNYEVTGSVAPPPGTPEFGLAVYAQMPIGALDGYFLRVDLRAGTISLKTPAPTTLRGTTSGPLPASPRQSWRFRVAAETTADASRVRARIWNSEAAEPKQWTVEAIDTRVDRPYRGAVGLMLPGASDRRYDGSIKVTIRRGDDSESVLAYGSKGVVETPVDEPLDRLGPGGSWMTLDDINTFIETSRHAQKPLMLEAKLRKLLQPRVQPSFTILVSHRPDVVGVADGKHVDLVLAGHTQGGQIAVPFLNRLVLSEYDGQLLDSGLKNIGDTHLYINRGIGTSRVPVRIGSPPEVTQFELVAAE